MTSNDVPRVAMPVGTPEWFQAPEVRTWRRYLGDDIPICKGGPTIRQIVKHKIVGELVQGGTESVGT